MKRFNKVKNFVDLFVCVLRFTALCPSFLNDNLITFLHLASKLYFILLQGNEELKKVVTCENTTLLVTLRKASRKASCKTWRWDKVIMIERVRIVQNHIFSFYFRYIFLLCKRLKLFFSLFFVSNPMKERVERLGYDVAFKSPGGGDWFYASTKIYTPLCPSFLNFDCLKLPITFLLMA